MRVVVDTNVFVSAVLKANSLPFLVVRWIDRNDGLLKSTATEAELLTVLQRPYIARVRIPSFRDGLIEMLATAELVTITERVAVCRDPTDDKFLELAINGHAEMIVSGDADLLALNPFRGIPIVPPGTFVQRVAG
jgi:putative PIN family toxin of toxin-antitoxin system